MAEPSFSTTISTATTPVVISGSDSALSWVTFTPPARMARISYASPSPWLHGSTAVSSVWEHTSMGGDIRAEGSTEAELRATVDSLRAAVEQFNYVTTVAKNGASDNWSCDMGSLSPIEYDYGDMRRYVARFTLTIPCFPIPGA